MLSEKKGQLQFVVNKAKGQNESQNGCITRKQSTPNFSKNALLPYYWGTSGCCVVGMYGFIILSVKLWGDDSISNARI